MTCFTEKGFRPALYYKANRTTSIQQGPTQIHAHTHGSPQEHKVVGRVNAEGTAQQALNTKHTRHRAALSLEASLG